MLNMPTYAQSFLEASYNFPFPHIVTAILNHIQVCFWHEQRAGRCVCYYKVIMTIITAQVRTGVLAGGSDGDERKAIMLLPGCERTTGISAP